MALTEEETVRILQDASIEYINTLDTNAKWTSFIQNTTTATIKTFLQDAMAATSSSYDAGAVDLSAKSDDLDDLIVAVGEI